MHIPYLVKILVSLAVILVMYRAVKKLSLSMAIGTVALVFWCGHTAKSALNIALSCVFSYDTFFLTLVVFQVIWLSIQMAETGSMKNLVGAVKALTGRSASFALLPALIGLLPMPGGALFSAPLVQDCDSEELLRPELKTCINYWFRHIWEYWWPLYPGVLLAVQITGLPMLTFSAMQILLSVCSVTGGYLFILRKIPRVPAGITFHTERKKNILIFARAMLPVFITVVFFFLIRIIIPGSLQINTYVPMIGGIFFAQVFLQIISPLSIKKWLQMIFSKESLSLALLVVIIRLYGAYIDSPLPHGTLLIDMVRNELLSWGIPFVFLYALLPYICGLTTGICVGFVGASFPLIMNLLGNNPPVNQIMAVTALGYGFGYIGMILSPVHVCLVVTNKYFCTSPFTAMRHLVKPSLCVLAGATGLYVFFMYGV